MNWIDYEVEKPADGQVVAICTDEGQEAENMRHHLKILPIFLCRETLHSGNIAYRTGFHYQTSMELGNNSHFLSAKKSRDNSREKIQFPFHPKPELFKARALVDQNTGLSKKYLS